MTSDAPAKLHEDEDSNKVPTAGSSLRHEDIMESHEAHRADSESAPSQTPDFPSTDNQHTAPSNITGQPVITGKEELGKVVSDTAILNEVHGSFQTMGSGVQELVATFNDVLGGSSDSESGDSDASYDSAGSRKFSWRYFMERAQKRRKRRRRLLKSGGPHASAHHDDDGKDNDSRQTPQEVILGERECNYEQFYSRYIGKEHKLHCIDVLLADDSLADETRDFEAVVDKIRAGEIMKWKPEPSSRRISESIVETNSEEWIRRIRINSLAVMKVLQHVCQESDDFGRLPMVFRRPFQLLIDRYGDVKTELARMKRFGNGGTFEKVNEATRDSTQTLETSGSPTQDQNHHVDPIQKLCEDANATKELECFVEFMESRILPDSRRYEDPSPLQAQSIRYEDLWYLFKPGDLIYGAWSAKDRSLANWTDIYRVIVTSLTAVSERRGPEGLSIDPNRAWSLISDYIDYDGTSYSSVPAQHWLQPFRGKKKVTDLSVFPVSYLKESSILAQAQADGAAYVNLLERRFGFYSGWTRAVNPFGPRPPVPNEAWEKHMRLPEHIEGDILVDYQETFNAIPSWKGFFLPASDPIERFADFRQVHEEFNFDSLGWDDTGKTHVFEQYERHLETDGTECKQTRTFLKSNPFGLTETKAGVPSGLMLALLPKRVFAYAVLQRKFVQVNIEHVRSADREVGDKAFEKLEINPSYKKLILALVKSHFDKIETEKRTNVEIETQDLIRGKGKGVVILLHGVPGVGKTATAEALAQKWKKPLFPITCGDLGYTAESLEKSLKEIFRLAHLWGCILLLDEADVFITRRERHDLKRNALVSGKYNTPASMWR